MGASASGKSTVGELLAKRLGIIYADGDDFHSQANIAKMQGGTPLTDEDRWPWLETIGKWLHEKADQGGVISCSALKRAYRDRLRAAAPELLFLCLCGGEQELRRRVAARKHHFMPASLLDSQLATLEPLEEDETGIAIDLTLQPGEIVATFIHYLDRLSMPTVDV
jgi:gluconokinase